MKGKIDPGSVAVVTGAGGGLGRALCLELAARGAVVAAVDIDLSGAEETLAAIEAAGGRGGAWRCDVGEWAEVEALREAVEATLGPVELLANNAGVAATGPLEEISLERWRWSVDVNLYGVLHGLRAFLPGMRARGRGRVLNVASIAAFASLAEMGPYNATKAAVVSISETLAAELRGSEISVTALCPSFFMTQIMASAQGPDDETRARVEEIMRGSRVQAPQVAARAVDALLAGRLYAFPMAEAGLIWRAKRLAPRLLAWALGRAAP